MRRHHANLPVRHAYLQTADNHRIAPTTLSFPKAVLAPAQFVSSKDTRRIALTNANALMHRCHKHVFPLWWRKHPDVFPCVRPHYTKPPTEVGSIRAKE